MKKSLLALAALSAVAGVAQAQSSVTLYGTLDVGAVYTTNTLAGSPNAASTFQYLPSPGNGNANSGTIIGMAGSNTTASKWGIKGVEDMGGGNKATFTLESALNLNYGTNPNGRLNDTLGGQGTQFAGGEGSIQGQMFDREASVGLSGAWGSLKAGRMTTPMADTIGAYDPMRVGYAVSPLGFNGGYGAAGFTGEARWDNSLKYEKSFGNVNVAAGYKTGNTPNGVVQGQAYAFALEYAQPTWSVKAAWAANNDAIIASNATPTCAATSSGNITTTCTIANVPGALALTFADTNGLTLAGKYVLGAFTFKGGWEHINTYNPNNAANDTLNNYATINGLPVGSVATTSYTYSRTQDMYWLGVNYQATSKVELSAAAYQLNTSAYGSTAGAATMAGTSTANYYSAMATYAMSPRTKLYATALTSTVSGPVWNGVANSNTVSTGVVHSF